MIAKVIKIFFTFIVLIALMFLKLDSDKKERSLIQLQTDYNYLLDNFSKNGFYFQFKKEMSCKQPNRNDKMFKCLSKDNKSFCQIACYSPSIYEIEDFNELKITNLTLGK